MKLYLHANTDQVYSALTNNSITSFANTIEKLQHKTLSFMSDHFIFLSKTISPEGHRHFKTDDIFFPVTLECDFTGVDNVPGYVVTLVDGKATIAENISNLKDASEEMIGAFICGEIPFAFVSAIIFENEENKVRFRRPSPDLWFPEELYKVLEPTDDASIISIEEIVELSQKVDELLSDEDKKKVASIVNKRNRYKGLYYFALRETKGWETDNFKSNVDSYLVQLFDAEQGEDGILRKTLNEKLLKLQEEGYDVSLLADAQEVDEILLKSDSQTSLDKKILETVVNMFYSFDKGEITTSREVVHSIKELVLSNGKYKDGNDCFDVIASFLQSSDMNPQKALNKLGTHSVCKALMKFLDSSDNDGFMKYGCEDLNQYERRYAYMMFGALKGMLHVEREQKSNLALEHRLEELALKKFSSDIVISAVPVKTFENGTYGINVECAYWMGKTATKAILSDTANIDKVKEVYKLIAKDKNFKVKGLECLEEPCVVTLSCGELKIEKVVKSIDDFKKLFKDSKLVTEFAKKAPMKIQYAVFLKKYIQDEQWYSALFDKYYVEIQSICRR